MSPSYPFSPGGHKAQLSAFSPLVKYGRFPPLIVVDSQAKTPPWGLHPAVRRTGCANPHLQCLPFAGFQWSILPATAGTGL